jgi:rRNA biogenesis protein RRP5
MKRLINYDKSDNDDSEEERQNANPDDDEDMEDLSDDSEMPEDIDDMDDDDEEGEDENSDADMEAEDSDEDPEDQDEGKMVGKKRSLKERIQEEHTIRSKEKQMRSGDYQPKDMDDFERLLIANKEQSYLWIQYVAFMLDNLGVDAARKIAERALKSIPMSSEQDKLNVWTAYMNLESNFGDQTTLEAVTKRALEVNDKRQVYMKLIDIYKSSKQFGFIEPIFR